MFTHELLQQRQVMIVSQRVAQLLQHGHRGSRRDGPGRAEHPEMITQILDVLAPFVKRLWRWRLADALPRVPPAPVALLQTRFNRPPAAGTDFETRNPPPGFLQPPFRQRTRIRLANPADFAAAMPAQFLPDFGEPTPRMLCQLLERPKHHPRIPRRSQRVERAVI